MGMVLAVSLAGPPVRAGDAPKLPRGFAGERFASVTLMRGLPTADWRAAQGYMHWAPLIEADTPRGGRWPTELDTDFGVIPSRGPCVRHQVDAHRIFVLAGLGPRFDFLIYRHSPEQSNDPEHDHLLVFRRLPTGERTLAFSCVGKLPRRVSAVSAAVAAGQCREEAGPFEAR